MANDELYFKTNGVAGNIPLDNSNTVNNPVGKEIDKNDFLNNPSAPARLDASVPLPPSELPDILYVKDGMWILAREWIDQLLENPGKATVDKLKKLVEQITNLEKLVDDKVRRGKEDAKDNKDKGKYVELTERKVRMHFDELIEMTGSQAIAEFNKRLSQSDSEQ